MGRCTTLTSALQRIPIPDQEIFRVGRPDNLTDLHILTQSVDARHGEYHKEIAGETTVNKAQDKPNDNGKTPTSPANQNSSNKNLRSSGTFGNTPTSTALVSTLKPASTPAPKLGKDGRLTQEERWHHMDNNLCLFCGKSLPTIVQRLLL